jgi:SAM-dependent methyltransferase
VSESVDLVCCHQGLHFFPDGDAVLAEVRRVLRPNGRVAVAVWGRLEDNPWPAALSDAVRALLGDPAGDSMSIVCRLGGPDDLAGLLRNANFDDVAIEARARTAKHPNAATAVAGQLSALPSGTAIDDLAPGRRTELAAKMCRLLNGYIGPRRTPLGAVHLGLRHRNQTVTASRGSMPARAIDQQIDRRRR